MHPISAFAVLFNSIFTKSFGWSWKTTSFIRPKSFTHKYGWSKDLAPDTEPGNNWYAHDNNSDPVLFNRQTLCKAVYDTATQAFNIWKQSEANDGNSIYILIEHNHLHLGEATSKEKQIIKIYTWKNLDDQRYPDSKQRYQYYID